MSSCDLPVRRWRGSYTHLRWARRGNFADARKAYDKALELEPNNNFIRNNYDQFREIYDRQNRRRDR